MDHIIENLEIKKLSNEERKKLYGHNGVVVWLTGLSGSGKSTIAYALERGLVEKNIHAVVLDGDRIRKGLSSDLGFSHDDRTENIRRIGEVAKLFHDACSVTIVACISPYNEDRDRVRRVLREGYFIEVYLDCPLEVCAKRDVKELYKKAKLGEIKEFTGISAPYEPPNNPEIHLRTDAMNAEQCVDQIISFMLKKNYLEIEN